MQPSIMNHTYRRTNQTSTNQTTKTTTSTWVWPLTQNVCSYKWDNTNSGVFVFKFQPISKNSYSTNFMHHQFVHFIDPENLYVYWWTISYISSIPTWICYRISCVMLDYFKFEQNLLTNSIRIYIPSQAYVWISEKFSWSILYQTLILAKKMRLTFKMTCCTFVFL